MNTRKDPVNLAFLAGHILPAVPGPNQFTGRGVQYHRRYFSGGTELQQLIATGARFCLDTAPEDIHPLCAAGPLRELMDAIVARESREVVQENMATAA